MFLGEKEFIYQVNLSLLVMHAVLLLIFAWMHADIMVCVNCFSICIYLVCFWVIRYYGVRVFMPIAYLEIWIHMICSIVFVGWDFGMQIYCFALLPVYFYHGYLMFQMSEKKKLCAPVVYSAISIVIYFVGRFYTRLYEPYYELMDYHKFIEGMYLLNSVAAFIFLISFMYQFVMRVMVVDDTLKEKALFDQLTGVHNRFYMNSVIEKMDMSEPFNDYWVAIMDIDDFKGINDTYGHICGDYVLAEIAGILSANNEKYEVCRWGGEEFLLLGKEETGTNLGYFIIEKIRQQICDKHYIYNEQSFAVSATFGLTYYKQGEPVNDWVNRADCNLYEGKKQGKNCVKM